MGRIDPRILERIKGPAWQASRPTIEEAMNRLLAASPDAWAELTTVYIKFLRKPGNKSPYAVLWIKKSTEIILGLAVKQADVRGKLEGPMQGYKYAGLNGFIRLHSDRELPPEFDDWVKQAYAEASTREQPGKHDSQ